MSYAAYRSVRQIRQPKGLMASLALPQELVGAHHLIVAGMAPSIVNELAALLGCDVKIVCQLVGIDRSTVTRKRTAAALLSRAQSARIYSFVSVMEAAESLFEGDRGKALEWLNKPARALGGNPPATFLTTSVGAQAVIDLIGQIEHGVVV